MLVTYKKIRVKGQDGMLYTHTQATKARLKRVLKEPLKIEIFETYFKAFKCLWKGL